MLHPVDHAVDPGFGSGDLLGLVLQGGRKLGRLFVHAAGERLQHVGLILKMTRGPVQRCENAAGHPLQVLDPVFEGAGDRADVALGFLGHDVDGAQGAELGHHGIAHAGADDHHSAQQPDHHQRQQATANHQTHFGGAERGKA